MWCDNADVESLYPSLEFGALRSAIDRDGRVVPAMEYLPAAGESEQTLRSLWLAFPDHPALFPAADASDGHLLLRYAALVPSSDSVETMDGLARFGAFLADVYRTLVGAVTDAEIGLLSDPFFKIDAAKQLRVGFWPVDWSSRLGRETKNTWPRCDERSLVHLIGELVSDREYERMAPDLTTVIRRCREPKPDRRYQTLDELHRAFTSVDKAPAAMTPDALAAWRSIEVGIGWLELGNAERAVEQLDTIRDDAPYANLARRGRDLAREALRERAREVPSLPWASAEPTVLRLENAGDLAGALRTCSAAIVEPADEAAAHSVRARLHLALGDLGHAIDYARRAITADDSLVAPRAVLAKALLARRAHGEALVVVDELLRRQPGDATHHYLRGKVLIALGRPDDARTEFELASSIQPTLLEAMLLRREVDRRMVAERKQVGAQGPIDFEIPESLAELRGVLVGGPIGAAIAALSEPRFADHSDAQLVLARILVVDHQRRRAEDIFDRVARMPGPNRHRALVGKAELLIDLGDIESALAVLEVVIAERPNELDAIEARARALERLGRTDEAIAEYRRFVALAASRSDVRVRAAQLWLEEHAP